MPPVDILEMADKVKRTTYRLKNSGDDDLYMLGLKMYRKIKKQTQPGKAKDLAETFHTQIAGIYDKTFPIGIGAQQVMAANGYEDGSNNQTSIDTENTTVNTTTEDGNNGTATNDNGNLPPTDITNPTISNDDENEDDENNNDTAIPPVTQVGNEPTLNTSDHTSQTTTPPPTSTNDLGKDSHGTVQPDARQENLSNKSVDKKMEDSEKAEDKKITEEVKHTTTPVADQGTHTYHPDVNTLKTATDDAVKNFPKNCSGSTNHVAKQYGITDLEGKRANDQVEHMEKNWKQVDGKTAKQLADEGHFVVAGLKDDKTSGHTTVVIPGEGKTVGDKYYPKIKGGAENKYARDHSDGNHTAADVWRPTVRDKVKYYVPPPPENKPK